MPAFPPLPLDRQNQRLGVLGRLAGSVGHDFNNLLGTISNNSHVLRDLCADAQARQLIDSTLRAVEAGSRLTQHLLRLAHHRPRPPQRVDLVRQLPDMLEVLQELLGRRVILSLQLAPAVPSIHVDVDELELTLLALGLDAREAAPRGGRMQLQAAAADAADLQALPAPDAAFSWVKLRVTGDLTGQLLGLQQARHFCEQAGGTARMLAGGLVLLLPAAAG